MNPAVLRGDASRTACISQLPHPRYLARRHTAAPRAMSARAGRGTLARQGAG